MRLGDKKSPSACGKYLIFIMKNGLALTILSYEAYVLKIVSKPFYILNNITSPKQLHLCYQVKQDEKYAP
jgi:hypothetical protein